MAGILQRSLRRSAEFLRLARKTNVADEQSLEQLEELLLRADFGPKTSAAVVEKLRRAARRGTAPSLNEVLREELLQVLAPCEAPVRRDPLQRPWVILVVGVNGSGKTTTTAKLARYYQRQGASVMLAAGDTFRAAAVEQLQQLGKQAGVPVVAQHSGADGAAVVYDALQSARARDCDILIADTAGRLHNRKPLMEELAKLLRVLRKLDSSAPHEVLLVLDAGVGQNALRQSLSFRETAQVSGLVLSKLDGSARGGAACAAAVELGLPIHFLGTGESLEDLQPFAAQPFVDALLAGQEEQQFAAAS